MNTYSAELFEGNENICIDDDFLKNAGDGDICFVENEALSGYMEKIEKIIVRTSQHTHLFYEKQGFVLRETIANYWSEGFDLYFMEYTNNNKMGTILNNH